MSKHSNIKEKEHRLTELIDYYEVCNRAEGKSPKTIDWYSANLKQFYYYLDNKHLSDSIGDIDIKLLREYTLFLLKKIKFAGHPYCKPVKKETISVSTVHGHVRTLRAFCSWAERENITDHNIARDLKPPKLMKKIVPTLTDEEIKAIFNCFNPMNPIDVRNQVIFMLLLDTGLRIGELVSLKKENLHIKEGYAKVIGKGMKERIVPIGNSAQKALQRFLYMYRTQPAIIGTDNVFLSKNGSILTANSMKLMFASLAQKSGIKRLHAHLCRHTFATRYLTNGGDIFSLQQILGHSTLEMVRHYVNLASSQVVKQHQKYSPVDNIKLR